MRHKKSALATGKRLQKVFKTSQRRIGVALGAVFAVFALIGAVAILSTNAVTSAVSNEPESGAPIGAAAKVSDQNASAQQAIKFGVAATPPPGPIPPPPDGGRLIWNGDFEPGNFSQYMQADTRQNGAGEQPVIVTSPVRQGSKAVKFTINGPASDISRTELLPEQKIVGLFREGQEFWFGHSTLISEGPINTSNWQVVWNLHHAGRTGSVPVEISQERGSYNISGNESHTAGGQFWKKDLGPVALNKWDDWQVRVKFSTRTGVGEVEVWRNGVNVVPTFKPVGGTLYPESDTFSYWKFGYYRNGPISERGTIYYDNVKMGTSRAIVAQRN